MIKDMTKGSITKHILLFSLPLLIGNVFQQLYSIVDAIVVGKYIGKDALAAVGVSFPITFLVIAFVMGLTMGGSILISQFYGAKRLEEVKKVVSTMTILLLIGSVFMTVFGLLAAKPILLLLKTPVSVMEGATLYLQIIFGGIALTLAYNAFGAIMRGLGDSWSPLIFLIISSILNAFLAFLFVAVFKWGIAGVGFATIIAQGFSSLLCLMYIWFRVPLLRYHKGEFVFDKDILKRVLNLGINTGLQQTILSIGFLGVQGIVNSFGSTTVAAVTAALRIDSIATLPIMALGIAVTSYTGQNIGANEIDRVRKGFHRSLLIVLVLCVFTVSIMLLFGKGLIGMFVSGEETQVIHQGFQYISSVSFFYILFGVMFVTNGVLRGSGDVFIPTLSTTAALFCRIACALLLIPFIGYQSIWWSIPVSWMVGVTFALIRYSQGKWKEKMIIQTANNV